MISFVLNDQEYSTELSAGAVTLDLLRGEAGLSGTREGVNPEEVYIEFLECISENAGMSGLRDSLFKSRPGHSIFQSTLNSTTSPFHPDSAGQLEQCKLESSQAGALRIHLNLPIAFAANYMIQNKVPLKWRFFSSAVFSSLMNI